jgi:hypothetical protein
VEPLVCHGEGVMTFVADLSYWIPCSAAPNERACSAFQTRKVVGTE